MNKPKFVVSVNNVYTYARMNNEMFFRKVLVITDNRRLIGLRGTTGFFRPQDIAETTNNKPAHHNTGNTYAKKGDGKTGKPLNLRRSKQSEVDWKAAATKSGKKESEWITDILNRAAVIELAGLKT